MSSILHILTMPWIENIISYEFSLAIWITLSVCVADVNSIETNKFFFPSSQNTEDISSDKLSFKNKQQQKIFIL